PAVATGQRAGARSLAYGALDGARLPVERPVIANMSRSQIVLSGLCAALALGLLYELFAPLPAHSIPSVQAANTVVLPPPPPAFIAPSAEAFAAIGDRPLFDSTRKKYVPPPAPEQQQANAPPPPPNLALVGVILDGQTKLAIVR